MFDNPLILLVAAILQNIHLSEFAYEFWLRAT